MRATPIVRAAMSEPPVPPRSAEPASIDVRSAVANERRNLLLQAPIPASILIGPDHVFELANAHYVKMVGGREVIGKRYVDAFPEIRGTELVDALDRVYQLGESYVAEEYLVPLARTVNGTPQDSWYRFSVEPLRDAEGIVYGMMCIAIDITEQVSARRTLERTTAEHERLLAALEAANRAKDEFLATISHELRTPLASILGWAQILTPHSDKARLEKGLAVIERNAKAQAQLIEDLLDISRIVSGKTRLNIRQVDAEATINAAVEIVRPLALAKQIRIVVSVDEEIGTITADEDRLQQVVWNLLSNAAKFTPKDGEIHVRARGDGNRVTITVADTGRGISPEFLPHVFDRFRQGDASTTKEQAGLGLGLAIVRHLVELHGGTVNAQSAGKGLGASFEIALPLRAVAPRAIPRAIVPRSPSATDVNQERLRDVHVLLVDDQDDARELVATVLESAGAVVTQADSVSDALDVLANEDLNVLVSDIGMPGEDGYSLLERLRSGDASLRSRDVPALALTAYARPEDRTRSLAAGFQEHTSKPIAAQKLVDIVAYLARR